MISLRLHLGINIVLLRRSFLPLALLRIFSVKLRQISHTTSLSVLFVGTFSLPPHFLSQPFASHFIYGDYFSISYSPVSAGGISVCSVPLLNMSHIHTQRIYIKKKTIPRDKLVIVYIHFPWITAGVINGTHSLVNR